MGVWEPHLFEAHQFGVVKDQKNAEDKEPGNNVEHKAEERHPGGPRFGPSLPQHWASGCGLPVPHHQLQGQSGACHIERPLKDAKVP